MRRVVKRPENKRGPKPPPFKVTLRYKNGPKQYEFVEEYSAILFCARYTRDMGITGTVFDPKGKVIVVFNKRMYDTMAHDSMRWKWQGTSISQGFQKEVESASKKRVVRRKK